MPDRAQLLERYPDLLEPDAAEDLLAMVAALDAAAEPYWRLEVPPAVDVAVSQLWRQPNRDGRARTTVPAADGAAGDDADSDRQAEIVPLGAARTRRWWLRQGLGMVAAVLMLALVGGVLAAVLRGPGSSGGTTPGSGPSGSGLPLTITAAGIPITLESVDASGTSTRFTFSVQLPPYASAASDAAVVLPVSAGNVQVTGLEDASVALAMSQGTHRAGQRTASFSLTFGSPVQPHHAVTVTLLRLGFAGIPPSVSVPPDVASRSGPWTFTIQPDAIAAVVLPTPDASGQYHHLTFAQAQELAVFYLATPQWVPPYLVEQDIAVSNGTPYVIITYGARDGSPRFRVLLVERNTPTQEYFPDNTTATLTLGGHTVTRVDYTNGGPLTTFQWQDQGTTFELTMPTGGLLTGQDAEHMIASMLQPAGAATPAAAAVVGVPTIGPVDSNAAGPHAQATTSTPKPSGGTGALWWVLWIVLGGGCVVLLAWLSERLGAARHPDDDGSTAHYLDEVEARARFPYM